MPISVTLEPESLSIIVTFAGVVTMAERHESLGELMSHAKTSTKKLLLIDMTGMGEENDPRHSLRIRETVLGLAENLKGFRIAVALPDWYLTPAGTIMEMQQLSLTVMDFRNTRDAREWLFEEQSS